MEKIKEMSENILQYAHSHLEVGDQDWRWCHKYAHDVVTGKIVAGRYIQKACERHLRDLERGDVYFDEKAAASVVLWFKFIPITDGPPDVVGKPTVLLPWQIFLVCNLVAWKWSSTGLRKYKYAYVRVGRKNGKSTLAAGLTLYFMYKSGYFQPRAYSLATKKDQAKILWSAALLMIRLSPRLKEIFLPRTHDIQMPSKAGEFKALASDSGSLDGLNPLVANLDECHAIKDRNLYGVIVSAFGAQPEGLMLTITTAGTVLDGICTDLDKAGKQVLDQIRDQESYFYAIYEIDVGDTWDDEENWLKANPGLGYQPRLDYLRDRCIEAQMSTEEKANFLTKHLNVFVAGYDKWLDIDDVKACRVEQEMKDFYGQNCVAALDRARVTDLTSFTVLIPTPDGGCRTFYINLLPRHTMENASDYLKQIYRKAVAEGSLELVDTRSVMNYQVEEKIKWICKKFKVEMFGYDPWHMMEVATTCEEAGLPMVSVSQGTGNMSEPAKKLEGLIVDGLFKYNDSLLEYAATCAIAKITDQNNMKVVRDNDKTDKIDPLISTIIALSCATLQKVETNIYESRGLICG